MSDKVRVMCRHCGKALNVPASVIGKSGKCPGCQNTIVIERPAPQQEKQNAKPPINPKPKPARTPRPPKPPETVLSQQPTHHEEFSNDRRRFLSAVSAAPGKFAIVEPYLMEHERPVAIAVQRQFPFSMFADIVLLSTHRLMFFKRFFTKIDMFDVNYVDFQDVTIKQGFFTSSIRITSHARGVCRVDRLVTQQALHLYRLCQDIETKARVARRQFKLEENRSRTTTMQVNNLLAPPESFHNSRRQAPLLQNRDLSEVGDEKSDPYRLGE